ncbi:helix-turn-helix transcriptional regulator [Mycobacterium sherrisii]|uniref:HTH araC/xylS-type domain-containing protein n=1 Tax=Mycobacterium sherrisii TaxID=243061 RepID=A0A1E3SIP3_9MYCO|nr:AraC family transcriptional regulator [Mycobacterium sherrisii]MCV7028011.1 helix-turn-helix transcriptional regulator [Mycobacterium sherrisii]MEC4765099.1 AraC family transcriptional regulator [Mycobacterium sherrisii]ODR01952.1 hypothetical protein BHQ21_22925 [Mycobacterium sherrisii]ORW84562.1 hypothetical protein AWC25_23980 [Mycobacterium sherrisii]
MTAEFTAPLDLAGELDAFSDLVRGRYPVLSGSAADVDAQQVSTTIHEQPLGQMWLVDEVMPPHAGTRTAGRQDSIGPGVVDLQYLIAGRVYIRQCDGALACGPGDLIVWDSEFSGTYEITETARTQTLVLPRALAAALLPALHRPGVARVAPGCQVIGVKSLFDLLSVLGNTVATLSPDATVKATALVIQLVADLGGSLPPGLTGGHLGGLRERVLWYIEENLRDPELSPATIAAAHYVSVRTLYYVLQTLDVPIAAHIRSRRLAHCYADLLNTDDPVSDIAKRWGFVSPPHFSRVFSRHYGISPSSVRSAQP